MQHNARRIFVAFFLLLGTLSVWAQPKFNSPFSRFGFGDLVNPNLPSLQGMGDINAAYQDGFNFNAANPAALASLRATAFEVGFNVRSSNWSSPVNNENVWSGNMSHLAIAFPMRNSFTELLEGTSKKVKMGMAFSLRPQTQVGYNIQVQELINNSDEPIDYAYQGSGGTYSLNWGYGLEYNNLSLGTDLGFLFGHVENLANGIPTLLNTAFSYETSNEYSIKGFLGKLGAQYNIILPDKEEEKNGNPSKKMITVGAYYGFDGNTTTTTDLLSYRQRFAQSLVVRDTFAFVDGVETKGKYPGTLGLGVHYVHKDKLRIGVNYTSTAWSNFENTVTEGQSFENANTFSVGGEWVPNQKNYKTYLERVRYRVGFVNRKDYRQVLNNSLTNTGVTFGLGLPVILPRQQVSFVNVSFELGKFGVKSSLQETYAQLSLGFTLNDNSWFFKRKFN